MTEQELEQKYLKIPQEMKQIRRWVCYRIEIRDGKETKVPYNAINNSWAKSNDPETWTTFRLALLGYKKYRFDGIGFMLGEDLKSGVSYFGIDLDNHPDQNGKYAMSNDEFNTFAQEFINQLNSYTEYSHSGKGIHIICKGFLPTGAKRKAGVAVEMYDKGRFFTMTGKAIGNRSICERTEEIKPLWEKYLNTEPQKNEPIIFVHNSKQNGITFGENVQLKSNTQTFELNAEKLDDTELIEKISSSRYGTDFVSLYNGDMSKYGNDHSAADMALCQILAFWTACDIYQMDRIFRTSALMREKWDSKRGNETYGNITLNAAIARQNDTYIPPKKKISINFNDNKNINTVEPTTEVVQFDEKHDPIVNLKNIFKNYPLNDTGNAERFYDYFGDNFKYNRDNQYFMFWNGKTWLKDIKGYIRKYANKMIDVLKQEVSNTQKEISELNVGEQNAENDMEKNRLNNVLKAQIKNVDRVSNKSGKDAMISELQTLHDFPVVNKEFDKQEMFLNTDSGVVNLLTGEILPFDRKYMLSKNTNCKVSFEEPKVWLKFLKDLFKREKEGEEEELINTIQLALGETLTGRTNKEHLYILYGSGSNGKSTFIKVVNDVFGDYGTSMNSDMLIQNPNSNSQSNEFSLSSLLGMRMVSTSETAEGKRLDEVTIKRMLSGEKINAQFKYGQPFSFMPTFSPWMSTNNKPVIRATDFGTWRRIFFIPFLNTFTGDKKDINMPKKLEQEAPQILGWMIQGAVKLYNEYNGNIPKPKCLEEALSEYKKELDVIVAFLNDRTIPFPGMEIEASVLYQVYKEWAKNNGEFCFSESRFKLELPKKGYQLRKDINKGFVYCGLKLTTDRRGIVFGEQKNYE